MLDVIRTQASSWGVKILFGLIIIVFVFWGVGGMGGPKESIIGYVNDEPILRNEFQKELRRTVDAMRSQNPGADFNEQAMTGIKSRVLNTMIGNILLLKEAAKMGITVSNDEVRKDILQIPSFRDQSGNFDYKRYEFILQQQGQTPAEFEESVKDYTMLQKLQIFVGQAANVTPSESRGVYDFLYETRKIDYLLFNAQDYVKSVSVTDDEINKYYADHTDEFMEPAAYRVDFLEFTPKALAGKEKVSDQEAKDYYEAHKANYQQSEMVKARHILIKPQTDTEADMKKAEAEIKDIQAKLMAGKKFGDLAKKYSQDGSAKNGGELGWFGRGKMVEPFEEAAFALKSGEVSQPVKTPFGYHLILVEERREPGPIPFDNAKEQVKKTMAEEKAIGEMDKLLDEATEQAAGGITLKDIAQASGLDVNHSTHLTQENLSQVLGLSPEDAVLIVGLKPGKVSDLPMQVPEGYILVEKVEDRPAQAEPLAQVQDKIRTKLMHDAAMTEAKVHAKEALDKIIDPKTDEKALAKYTGKTKLSPAMGRQAPLPEIGYNQKLSEAVFAANIGDWLPEPYEGLSGYIVAKVATIDPPDEKTWSQRQGQWTQTMLSSAQQEIFQAFLQELMNEATIKITQGDILK